MTTISTLRGVPLFAKLRDSDLERLSGVLRARDYPKNRVVLFSYDPCDAFYIVLSGSVKVMLIAEDGREVVLDLVRSGDFFGESALMDDEPYSKSVIAVEDSKLLVLQRDDFRRSITEMPGMAFGLLRALCSRLSESDQKIAGLVFLDVTGRVAHLLLDMAGRGDGETIKNLPTHQMLAHMVGSSRETISRTIGTLVSQRLIETTEGGGIRILNHDGLAASAGHMLRRRPKKSPTSTTRISGQQTVVSPNIGGALG
ncbi:MAG TPA: Crp/Fnr family transcriptional regulator [Gemmatimonadaceae bacterium]|nr:Crp/Fnr family transcriptional regulator [Gemmatimonadaceae bacterium]